MSVTYTYVPCAIYVSHIRLSHMHIMWHICIYLICILCDTYTSIPYVCYVTLLHTWHTGYMYRWHSYIAYVHMTRRHRHCRECWHEVRFYQLIRRSVERHPRRSCTCHTHIRMADGIDLYATRIYILYVHMTRCHHHCRECRQGVQFYLGACHIYICPICILCDTYTCMAHGMYVYVTLIYPICIYDQASSSLSWVPTRSTISSVDTLLRGTASQKIQSLPPSLSFLLLCMWHSYIYGTWDICICDCYIPHIYMSSHMYTSFQKIWSRQLSLSSFFLCMWHSYIYGTWDICICDTHISYMYMSSHMYTSSQKIQSRPLPLSSLLSHTHSHAVARAWCDSFSRQRLSSHSACVVCVALCRTVLPCVSCVAVCCGVLQCVAVCRSVLHCALCVMCCGVLQCVAVCCTVLHCAVCVICCSVSWQWPSSHSACVVCVAVCRMCVALCVMFGTMLQCVSRVNLESFCVRCLCRSVSQCVAVCVMFGTVLQCVSRVTLESLCVCWLYCSAS